MKRWLILAVVVLGAVTACGHPLVPHAALHDRASTAAPPPSSSPPTRAPATPPVLGVDLYAAANHPLSVVEQDGARNLTYMRQSLGAQSVGIVWNFYAPTEHSNTVSSTSITLSPENVATLTKMAEARHMGVQFRPLIRVTPKWVWEGYLTPTDVHAWFASLFQAELPYLRIAQQLHVSEFVVGTEWLRVGATSSEWKSFLSQVHSVYHGTISYASQINQYFKVPRDLPPVNQVGVDPYFFFTTMPTSASTAQVIAAWDKEFSPIPRSLLERTMMDEVGIASSAGAYHHSPHWQIPGASAPQVQVRWFTAACTMAWRYHMRGVYFYEINLEDNPAHPLSFPGFFVDKPGAQAIHNCLTIFHEET